MIARLTTPEVERIVSAVQDQFRTFGGGRVNQDNPISVAAKDESAQFAAGVSVADVVRVVSAHTLQIISDQAKGDSKRSRAFVTSLINSRSRR